MSEKFPEIFKNKIDNTKMKVQNEYYCRNVSEEYIDEVSINKTKKISRSELLNKINSIFKRPDYIYQADITIITKNGESMSKKIVGIKDNYLLTLDEEKIYLDDIYDIK